MSSEANRNVLDEEEDEGEGTLVAKGIFKNRSFAKTPCFRESYLYGISGGLLTGITYFMFTSLVQKATMISVVSGCAICLCSYTYCRHKRAQDNFKYQRLSNAIKEYIEKRGCEEEDDD